MMKYCIASEEEYFKKIKCSKKCEYWETCKAKDNEERRQEYEENEKYMRTTSRHDKGELAIMQGYSLERKIQLTCERIQAWYEHYDGKVYISFSGGKDSTVLLDIVRNRCGYTDVPAVYSDTGLEFPQLREFVKTFDNITWIKPDKNFKEIIKEYGYPIFGKEIAETIFYSRRYIEKLRERETILTEQNRTEQNRTEQNRTEQNRTRSRLSIHGGLARGRQERGQRQSNIPSNQEWEYP